MELLYTDQGIYFIHNNERIGPFDTRKTVRDMEQARVRTELNHGNQSVTLKVKETVIVPITTK